MQKSRDSPKIFITKRKKSLVLFHVQEKGCRHQTHYFSRSQFFLKVLVFLFGLWELSLTKKEKRGEKETFWMECQFNRILISCPKFWTWTPKPNKYSMLLLSIFLLSYYIVAILNPFPLIKWILKKKILKIFSLVISLFFW